MVIQLLFLVRTYVFISVICTLFPMTTNTVNASASETAASVLVDDSSCSATMVDGQLTYEQDGIEAREIAQYIPYFPFKGIDRFYDIGGFLYVPHIFEKIVNIFVKRYETLNIDVIAGYVISWFVQKYTSLLNALTYFLHFHHMFESLDARGFVLGPPIALKLQKPFIMMRKKGKMPNAISTDQGYKTEYGNREGLTVQRDKILPGQRVLIIDDLVATGGTLSSAISLVKLLDGVVVECACIVELKLFINPTEESGIPSRTKLMQSLGHDSVPIWGLISEDVLTVQGTLPSNYVDDGEEH